MQVRDLIEHLQTFPPEMRLEFTVEDLRGNLARADNYRLGRDADVIDLKVTGALIKTLEIAE